MKISKKQSGFTILELMIATSVFSVILLVGSMMLLQIGKMYYRGLNSSKVQESSRTIVEEITRNVQFSSSRVEANLTSPAQAGVAVKAYCVGDTRYTVAENVLVVPGSTLSTGTPATGPTGPHALWKDKNSSGGCNPVNIIQSTPKNPDNSNSDGEELLGENMRIGEMCVGLKNVSPATPNPSSICESSTGDQNGAVSVNIRVLYGEKDLIKYSSPPSGGFAVGCGTQSGSQWCASSQLKAQVFRRL